MLANHSRLQILTSGAIPFYNTERLPRSPFAIMTTTINLNAWIKCPKPNPQASLRLFCFPYAGARAMIYRSWLASLPPSIELYLVEFPGRATRIKEPSFRRIQPLIEALTPACLPYLDKPFVFFGHSMGALIAFELIRELRKNSNLIPLHLLVSGRRAPQLPDPDPPIHALPTPQFLQGVVSYNGTDEAVLNNADLMQLLLPILRADFELLETYVYEQFRALDCPITVFGGLEDNKVNMTQLEAWRELTTKSFSRQMFPGGHFFLHSAESLLLQSLNQTLDRLVTRQS